MINEKLVKNLGDVSLDIGEMPSRKEFMTNRIKRIAVPYLRHHTVKGRLYYTYCQTPDKEIYLGTADNILEAVMRAKLASGKNRP